MWTNLPNGVSNWVRGTPANYAMDPNITQSTTYGPEIQSALLALPTMSITTSISAAMMRAESAIPAATRLAAAAPGWAAAGGDAGRRSELKNPNGERAFHV